MFNGQGKLAASVTSGSHGKRFTLQWPVAVGRAYTMNHPMPTKHIAHLQ